MRPKTGPGAGDGAWHSVAHTGRALVGSALPYTSCAAQGAVITLSEGSVFFSACYTHCHLLHGSIKKLDVITHALGHDQTPQAPPTAQH